MLTPSFGARPGQVYITDGENTVIVSPNCARLLAERLPQIATWAETLAASVAAEPQTPYVGEMARVLHAAGWKWYPLQADRRRGFWGRFDPDTRKFTKTKTADYRSATTQAHQLESAQ